MQLTDLNGFNSLNILLYSELTNVKETKKI